MIPLPGVLGEEEVRAIEARAKAATPGPWFGGLAPDGEMVPNGSGGIDGWIDDGTICAPPEADEYPEIVADGVEHPGNRAFIVHARSDIPALLASHAALSRLATLRSASADRLAYAVEAITADRDAATQALRVAAEDANAARAEADGLRTVLSTAETMLATCRTPTGWEMLGAVDARQLHTALAASARRT